ncbi:hypothetical protein [Wenzhouxiangella marina]|uniref:Uncharacterized protein n=1 Tax=Wenzhouxiangella marina TaxID=1579979 RepID=A0A0K0XUS2_9GAMM|nr:hypothetical protein [Wenzhouxiangella marina]AKS41459.1 hypothetical protein WM2015_1084 [Wenzhouxiangella marina]MBB6086784.1 tetratricopeptide (TPR) repeat protein [Wenzhouxiangella marina]
MNKKTEWTVQVAIAVVCWLVTASVGLACGPYYGSGLLQDRERALLSLEDGSFAAEAPLLVPPPEGLPREAETIEREALDRRWLSAEQRVLVTRLRELESAEQAYAQGDALPEAIRAYTAGAVAWYADDLPAAKHWFTRAAEQSPASNDPWPLMGEYMLARVNKQLLIWPAERWDFDDEAALAERQALAEAAVAGFERVRDRVRAGEIDPLGLSVGSLGEQAGVHDELGQLQEQILLYAQQAALGSHAGRTSLLFLARWIRIGPDRLDEALATDVGLDLMVLFAYTHFPSRVGPNSSETWRAYSDFGMGRPGPGSLQTVDVLARILDRVEALPAEQWPATDRLAALLYRQGHYDWAERAVAGADGPLADWVRAKLSLRADRPEQAAEYFQLAMRGFEGVQWDRNSFHQRHADPSCLIAAEAGLLALSRDELTSGFELMVAAGPRNWLDAAYLAEYVLTLDELQAAVDRMPAPSVDFDEADPEAEFDPDWPFYGTPARDVHTAAHYLLARRLMREGRYEEAIGYFPWAVSREHAQRYAELMTPVSGESELQRAQRLFEAARMTRLYGLRLLGWETEPDYAAYGANFRLDTGVAEVLSTFEDPAQRAWMAQREIEGVESGRIRMGERYSYRYAASELADQAADHLPPESETFAAVLCHATRWLLLRNSEVALRYYRRYREEGQPVEWQDRFGQDCPEPDWG